MVRNKDFAETKCPRDCPFLDKIASGQTMRFCSFSLYANYIEPQRMTRTETKEDGTVDYHIPPDCDIYEKYKGRRDEVRRIKKKHEGETLSVRMGRTFRDELVVTAHKHKPVEKHHGDF